jgi:hypothetical protein
MKVIYEQFTGKENVLIFPGISSCSVMVAAIGGGQLVGAHFSYKTETNRRLRMLNNVVRDMGSATVSSMYFVGVFRFWPHLRTVVGECKTVLGYNGQVYTYDLKLKEGKSLALKAWPIGNQARLGSTKDLEWKTIEGNRLPSSTDFKELKRSKYVAM